MKDPYDSQKTQDLLWSSPKNKLKKGSSSQSGHFRPLKVMKVLNLIAGNFYPLFYKLFNDAYQIILSQGGREVVDCVTGFLKKKPYIGRQ